MVQLILFIQTNSAIPVARALGVTVPAVMHWASGARPVPVKRCVQIELATGGQVTRKDLRADWREIWPELEALERAAAAVRRLKRRTATRNRAAVFPGSKPRRPHSSRMVPDLLLLSLTATAAPLYPRFREFRL